ncbi:MAG: HRDC domain-containing protein, partial [Alphaproteobacteria bacterium]|nr:HRDC domain-containing protein [Alphaproteobacteria bacterium]
SLVEQFSGQTFSKGGQKSDWSRRPLSPAQLRYAVDDTRYLEPLADRLLAELDRLGRRHWFEQGCEAAIEATGGERETDPERQWRIKGVWDLTRSRAVFVRELWKWREREAERADRPPFKILGDAGLMELAAWAEKHSGANLARAPRLPRDFRGTRLESLREAILRAGRLGHLDWPEPRLRISEKRWNPGKGLGRLRDSNAVLRQDSPTPEPLFLPNIPSALFYKHLRLLSVPRSARIGQERDEGQAARRSPPRCAWPWLPNPSAGYRRSRPPASSKCPIWVPVNICDAVPVLVDEDRK